MCRFHIRNGGKEWCFCDQTCERTWEEYRYRLEIKFGFQEDKRSKTVLLGYASSEDFRNNVPIGDNYVIAKNADIIVERRERSTKAPMWYPPSIAEERWRNDIAYQRDKLKTKIRAARNNPSVTERQLLGMIMEETGLVTSTFYFDTSRQHPSHEAIRDHCLGIRIDDKTIKEITHPPCQHCLEYLGSHRSDRCPALYGSFRGLSLLPEPKGILGMHRTEVTNPSTVEEVRAIRWIDRDGRMWVEKKKDGR